MLGSGQASCQMFNILTWSLAAWSGVSFHPTISYFKTWKFFICQMNKHFKHCISSFLLSHWNTCLTFIIVVRRHSNSFKQMLKEHVYILAISNFPYITVWFPVVLSRNERKKFTDWLTVTCHWLPYSLTILLHLSIWHHIMFYKTTEI